MMPDQPENIRPPDTRFPENYRDATGKGDIRISGAGTAGMVVLIISLSMLFLASIAAFLIIRFQHPVWPPPPFPHVPRSLWLSTIVILAASVTVQLAHHAVRRDDDKNLARFLMATFIIGLLFLGMQTVNWIDYTRAISGIVLQGPYPGMFYILTALHAAHVIGGLIPLVIVYVKARRGRYSRNFHPGVRYVTLYWHFLDVIWVMLFAVLYF